MLPSSRSCFALAKRLAGILVTSAISVDDLHDFVALNAKLRGYYNYYGIRGNYESLASAAHPPACDEAPEPMPDWDLLQQPEPDLEFDQRVAW
jgi:hypothetical protein